MNYFLALSSGQISILIGLLILVVIPMLLAVIDILKSDFSDNDKSKWLLIVFFTNIFGVLMYYFYGRNEKNSFK